VLFDRKDELSHPVLEVPIRSITVPSPCDERIRYEELRALADSIREHGILEPLLVRPLKTGQYALIAGERRLKAALLEGFSSVPCVSVDTDDRDAAVLTVLENLHRKDLDLFEEAAAISSLIRLTGMTQEQCARRLAVSQSFVANKLRLLKLSPEEQNAILAGGLSERHARALLRIEAGDERMQVLGAMVKRGMNVAAAEEYVESLLCAEARAMEIRRQPEKSEQKTRLVLKDMRLFYNTIDHAVDVVRKSGIAVESVREETENGVVISIRLPDVKVS